MLLSETAHSYQKDIHIFEKMLSFCVFIPVPQGCRDYEM